jgi:trans-aconitate methyltransferase
VLLQAYHSRHGLAPPASILDIGCSTGISSRWYGRSWPQADITGLDLSPYFLAVAELEERCAALHYVTVYQ